MSHPHRSGDISNFKVINTFFLVWIMVIVLSKLRSRTALDHDRRHYKAAKALVKYIWFKRFPKEAYIQSIYIFLCAPFAKTDLLFNISLLQKSKLQISNASLKGDHHPPARLHLHVDLDGAEDWQLCLHHLPGPQHHHRQQCLYCCAKIWKSKDITIVHHHHQPLMINDVTKLLNGNFCSPICKRLNFSDLKPRKKAELSVKINKNYSFIFPPLLKVHQVLMGAC